MSTWPNGLYCVVFQYKRSGIPSQVIEIVPLGEVLNIYASEFTQDYKWIPSIVGKGHVQ